MPAASAADRYSQAVTGSGVTDLAVGAVGDDTGGTNRGAVYLLFLNANGRLKSLQKIASGVSGGPVLAAFLRKTVEATFH